MAKSTIFFGGQIFHVIGHVSKTWLGDPWLWSVMAIILVIWWRWRCPSGNRMDPESEDSPRKQRKLPISQPDTVQPIPDVLTQSQLVPQNVVPTVPDVPPQTQPAPDQITTTLIPSAQPVANQLMLPSPSLAQCQIDLIQKCGMQGHQIERVPCLEVAVFATPLAAGDTLRNTPLLPSVALASDARAIPLCAKHWDTYHHGTTARTCHMHGCARVGIAFPVSDGMIYERSEHTKLRLLGGPNTMSAEQRKTTWENCKMMTVPQCHTSKSALKTLFLRSTRQTIASRCLLPETKRIWISV